MEDAGGWEGREERPGSRIRVGGGREPRKRLLPAIHCARQGKSSVESDLTDGQCAGLVEADHIDAGQSFDGRELIDEYTLVGQSRGPHGESDARHQNQTEWDHRRDRRDGVDHGLRPRPRHNRRAIAASDHNLGVEDEQADRPDPPPHGLIQ